MASQTQVELQTFSDGLSLHSKPPASEQYTATAPISSTDPDVGIQSADSTTALPQFRSWVVITQLAGINFITSFSNGLVTIALPQMAAGLRLHESLLLWPASVYALTSGSCFLLAGSFADVIGPRPVNLAGCFLNFAFMLGSGLSWTGIELIMFRAMQGIANALVAPSSISIISTSVESGKPRNIGFSCLGLASPIGFLLGLVLGGFLASGPGWRVGFYISAAVSLFFFVIGIWALPSNSSQQQESQASTWNRLVKEIDWIGACAVSASLALFSYVLATLSANTSNISHPGTIAMLVISLGLLLAFPFWMRWQEKRGMPALIPNSTWKNTAFNTVCIMILLANAVLDCIQVFSSLFFQEVQHTSALGASLRILPCLGSGVILNFVTGRFINKVPAIYVVLTTSVLGAVSPLLMAVINPKWPFWYDAFFAQLLSPLSVDVLFTVGILVISDVFPARTQGLAGAVFNTVNQLGVSIGLCTTSVISSAVTQSSNLQDSSSQAALMEGYRASFWAMFAWSAAACVIGALGLRKLGKIGEKRD